MKTWLLVTTMLLASTAHAEDDHEVPPHSAAGAGPAAPAGDPFPALLAESRARARTIRNSGIATFSLGMALTLAGVVMIARGSLCVECDRYPGSNGVVGWTGVALLGAGQIGAGVGVPLWAHGQAALNAGPGSARLTF
jgi:hypothetical protein